MVRVRLRALFLLGISKVLHPLVYLACLCAIIGSNPDIPNVLATKNSPLAPAKLYLPLILRQASTPVYPLKASANGRYLVDQNNVPFLMRGDSAQAMIGALSEANADTFLANRMAAGINAVWIHVLCLGPHYPGCRTDGSTYDGIVPFTTAGDLATPNPAYFTQVDHIIQLAAKYQMVVMLDPIETIGWLGVLQTNGATKDYNYGVYLGNRYKNFANIVWLHGNDFQTWQNSTDDADVSAVAKGIKSVDLDHLQTVELNYDTSDSLQDTTWGGIVGTNSVYSYYPQYAQALMAYNRANAVPTYFLEGVYEYQNYEGGYLGAYQLRNQEYWTQLSGTSGQLYGNANIYGFASNWQGTNWQSSPGITQFGVEKNLFVSRAWYSLVPDQNHTVVTVGYGTYANCCLNQNSDYVTAARTADGKLVIAYMPTRRTITVDMSKLTGTMVTAQWYDPTNGTYSVIGTFAPSGTRQFMPLVNNSSGDGDWVLVLEAN